jgi:hypothetical protein
VHAATGPTNDRASRYIASAESISANPDAISMLVT